MLNTYPHKPPHASYFVIVPKRHLEGRLATFEYRLVFAPLTYIHTDGSQFHKKACDHHTHIAKTFCPESLISIEDIIMPKNNALPQYEFVNLKLNESDVPKFHAWVAQNQDRFWQHLNAIVESGYKITLSPDADNSCIIATLTATKYASHNKNMCMTSRSDDPMEAYWLAFYKHLVLCDGESWGEASTSSNWG